MENKSGNAVSKGIGFEGVLTVAFIVLKLCHVIDWSWWWILAPIWIPTALVILIWIIYVTCSITRDWIKAKKKQKKEKES